MAVPIKYLDIAKSSLHKYDDDDAWLLSNRQTTNATSLRHALKRSLYLSSIHLPLIIINTLCKRVDFDRQQELGILAPRGNRKYCNCERRGGNPGSTRKATSCCCCWQWQVIRYFIRFFPPPVFRTIETVIFLFRWENQHQFEWVFVLFNQYPVLQGSAFFTAATIRGRFRDCWKWPNTSTSTG